MAVEVILMADVENLGQVGDVVRVADGYARNYLVPRGVAAPKTRDNLRRLEIEKKKRQEEYERNRSIAEMQAERIGRESVTIAVEAGEDDKLYGSVGPRQIADALAENDIRIDPDAIELEDPVRELGVYTVDVNLHAEVTATLKVWIVRK